MPPKKESEKAATKKADLGKMVKIQNRTSTPLHFSAPGFEYRLGPFETAEVPEAALVVGQLQRFIEEGQVVVPTAAAKAKPADEPEKPPKKESGPQRRGGERRADKPDEEE